MGNRAVIAFERLDPKSKKPYRDDVCIGIYLHWNGGRDSIEGLLQCAKDYGIRDGGDSYGIARLTQIACNFFGGTLSVGVDIVGRLDTDNYDNGTYWIDSKYNIVGREYFEGSEQKQYPLNEMVEHIKSKNDNHFGED